MSKKTGPGPNGMVAQMDWEEGRTLFAATDHLGHTRVLFDENYDSAEGFLQVMDFAPFGEQIEGPGAPGGPFGDPDTTHLFTGHERDLAQTSSELDYMHARYYSPTLGRFVSVDPVKGKVGGSQSWNRYSYVLNNPMNFIDPSGEEEYGISGKDDFDTTSQNSFEARASKLGTDGTASFGTGDESLQGTLSNSRSSGVVKPS